MGDFETSETSIGEFNVAEILEVQIIDVHSFTHGDDEFKGITRIRYTRNAGRLVPMCAENEIMASKFERVSDRGRFPVEFTVSSKSAATLLHLVDALQADAKFYGREAGTQNVGMWTITAAMYQTADAQADVNHVGEFSIHGVGSAIAYSLDDYDDGGPQPL